MSGEERPDFESLLEDISVALSGIDYSIGALVAIERFRVQSVSGTDPLEGTIYQNHGFDASEER